MQDADRLTRIEEKLAFLEKHIGDLDEVVRDLSNRIDQQRAGVTAVRKLIEDHLSDPGEQRDLSDDKPPHW